MNSFLERTIEVFSPAWASQRLAQRQVIEIQRGYDAGGFGKRQSRIDRTNRSAPAETLDSLGKLRGFSRNLERNHPVVKKAIKVLGNNIVGEGIRPAIVSPTALYQKRAREIWAQWAQTRECDFSGLHNIYGIQKLVCTSAHRDGECLVLRRRDKDGTVPIKIQVVEADFLDDTKTMELSGGHYVVQGVEFNASGKRVAYWLFEHHPYENIMFSVPSSSRILAEDVIHVYNQDRAGQVRGIPTGVQAFMLLEDLKEYQDAELVRKKVAACFTAFISTEQGSGTPRTAQQLAAAQRMEPGTLNFLSPGESITFGSPPPTEGYDTYLRVNLQQIASSYEITYEMLAGDLSNVNFSSGRMGWVEANKGFKHWQNLVLIPMLCDRIFDWLMDAAIMSGQLREKATVTWTPPRREFIDPAKEISALLEAVRAGFTSWQEVIRETGWTKEELLAELIEDAKMWDDAGLKPGCDPRFDKEPASQGKKPA